MAIKIDKMIKEEETRAAGFLWTTESDPTWLRYQIDLTTGAMKGFHVSRAQGTIPRVTPFLYSCASTDIAEAYHLQIATAIFADIGKETVIREGEEMEDVSVASQVGAWQNFMGAFEGGSKEKVSDDLMSSRFITYDRDLYAPNTLVKTGKRGALSMPRRINFRVGARMSGFDAVKIVRSKGLPPKLKVGAIGDPDIEQATEALKHVERPSSHAVAWYGIRDDEKAKYRLQAAASMPILAGLIADRQSLSSAVDEMRPIQPILIETTGLAKAGVKRVGKLTQPSPVGPIFDAGERIEGEDALGVNRARHTMLSGSVPIDMALRYLSELPPDRTPQDNESWLKFNDILTAVAIPLYNATSIPVKTILEASKGNWIQYHESLAKAADFDPKDFDRRTMALTTIDALEAIEHFNRTAVLPQALASIKETGEPNPMLSREFVISGLEAATNLIIGKAKNVAVLMMETSRRYASRIPAMMEIEGKSILSDVDRTGTRFEAYPENAYPVLTDDFTASNGLVVRPLRNGDELTEESRRLHHCVGGYQSKARRTQCHIFSVQNAQGSESYSTFEFGGIEGQDAGAAVTGLRTIQHRANHNATPSDDCKAAFKEFKDAISKGQVTINYDEISEWREWLKESGQDASMANATPSTTWTSVLELDWEDDETRMSYWQEWGEVLGGRVAKSPHPGAIYAEKKAQELVGAMSPRAAAIMIEQARQAREEKAAEKAHEDEPQPM